MDDRDWELLLKRIKRGRCTPFLGAGASAGTLPLGSEIAAGWADEYEFPLAEREDLSSVSQFVAVDHRDPMWPKEKIRDELEALGPPDFRDREEPHAALAELPLPVYMTTNYDDFMVQALRYQGKEPRLELCRWNRSPAVAAEPSALTDATFVPSVATPVVFHLHGQLDVPESLVLTEDDYLDFLVSVSRDEELLPHPIKRAIAGSSLLFIGYRLADWSFRVIHRGLVIAGEPSLRMISVTVQLRPSEKAEAYLAQYFGAMNVRVYWGTAAEFARELRERWQAFDGT